MSCRDGSARKRTAIKAWECGKVCGREDRGVCTLLFGGRAVNPEARLSGPTHPKKGVHEGGGAEKKRERANNTGQVRGACERGLDIYSLMFSGTYI